MRSAAALAALVLTASATISSQTTQLPQTIRIHAGTVLDGAGKTLRNATIVVQGSKITSIETGASGAATYDLGRLTVIPGMIDVHAHLGWHFGKDGRYQARGGSPAEEILYSA